MAKQKDEFDFVKAKEDLRALVQEFRLARYNDINETTSEQDIHHWVDRLLRTLGWNIDDVNEYSRQRYTRGAGIADAVLMNRNVPVAYLECKRIGGIPRLHLLQNQRIYYSPQEEQALRYARRSVDLHPGKRWTLLTNFEQLYLYEATTDERVLVFEQPEELIERFDEDTRYLTKREVLSGGLSRWLLRRGRPDIDVEFRDRLNEWRRGLAQDIYDRNHEGLLATEGGEPDLALLQSAVQRLLDRLIVLQFATDLEAIEGEPLRELLTRTEASSSTLVRPLSLHDELNATFARFDDFYNTTIFAPGHICEQVDMDDRNLRAIVTEVSGQNFRRFQSDVLGATYETYLGHTIEVDEAGLVRLTVKPDVRRAGGIYYTPPEVVQHIVDVTLAPLLANASLDDIGDLRIIDPACGSGSFLVAAYELLADWYENEIRKVRSEQESVEGQTDIFSSTHPQSQDYHRRILETHIYGVDLDGEAAEIAAINLIMTAIRRGMAQGSLKKLPAVLGQNIKVGNSVAPGVQALPGHAFLQVLQGKEEQLAELADKRAELQREDDTASERELMKVVAEMTTPLSDEVNDSLKAEDVPAEGLRPFAWAVEFPEVFDPRQPPENQGFSCVIGNPPWIGFTGAGEIRPYLARRFETCTGRFDMYVPFIELGTKLLRAHGRFGMITPSNFFLREYGRELRPWLKRRTSFECIIDFGDRQLFRGATNYPAILILRNDEPDDATTFHYLKDSYEMDEGREYLQSGLHDDHWIFLTPEEEDVFGRMSRSPSQTLGAISLAIMEGIITGQNDVFLVTADQAADLGLDSDILRLCPRGQHIKRWRVLPNAQYVIYPYDLDEDGNNVLWSEETIRSKYPRLHEYLQWKRMLPVKEGGLLGKAEADKGREDWALTRPREKALLESTKIICPEVAARPEFTVVDSSTYFPNSASGIVLRSTKETDTLYVTGLLNSQILGRFHQRRSVPKANGYLIFLHAFLKNIPIRFPGAGEQHLYDRIVRLVRHNLEAARELEALPMNFSRYIEEFPLESTRAGTVATWIEGVPLSDREVLSTRAGKLHSVQTEVRGTWLHILGRVRFTGQDYEAGEHDVEPLLKVRLPQPRMDFLRYYLPWSHLLKAFPSARKKSVYQNFVQQVLPRMNEEDIQRTVLKYERVFLRHQELRQAIAEAEAGIEEAVAAIYELSPEDLTILGVSHESRSDSPVSAPI